MPTAPAKPCGRIEAGKLCPNLRPCPSHKHKPYAQAQRSSNLYSTSRWQQMRYRQLRNSPLCKHCMNEGKVIEATVADHITPHRGDTRLFWDAGNLQSLCDYHHRAKTADEA